MQFELDINIDNEGLAAIYAAGQSVTLVKSRSNQPLASGNLPVSWLSFSPLQQNAVSWIENYYLYATTTQCQSGACIDMLSQTAGPAQAGVNYTFANGQFTGVPGADLVFNLLNGTPAPPSFFNFGLAQAGTVNGKTTLSPLNIQPVLFNCEASFTPLETVSIFLSSTANNGVVLSQVASNALTVTLSSQQPKAIIGFNDANNTFFQG
ncbi:MAG TPA: hypothetical protein VFK06_03420 [Candidatus Angelobacter sp.]|nr:hypothetical protein [Candidatus Angelobacter sp.]